MKHKISLIIILILTIFVPSQKVSAYSATIDLNYIDGTFSIAKDAGSLIDAQHISPGDTMAETLYIHNNSSRTLEFALTEFTESTGRSDGGEFLITVSHDGRQLTEKPLGFAAGDVKFGERLIPLAPNATTSYDITLKLAETAHNEYQLQQYAFNFVFMVGMCELGGDYTDDNGDDMGCIWSVLPLPPDTGTIPVKIGELELELDIWFTTILCALLVGGIFFLIITKRKKKESESKKATKPTKSKRRKNGRNARH